MKENKTLWQIIKSAAIGDDGNGSSKRMASFYFIVVLTTSLVGIEEYCYILASKTLAPTSIHLIVVKSHEPIIWSILISAMIYSGLTSVDALIGLIKFIRGGNVQSKEETNKAEPNN